MKQTEIKKLSKQDLGDKLVEYKKKLLELKMSHAVSPIENPKSAGGGLGGLRMTKSVNEMATVSPNGSALITVNEPATEPSPFSMVT